MRFSIVTVVLNDPEGLRRTYNSVVSQHCVDYEWLVLDGGSTDGTKAWLEDLRLDQLRWWSEPDEGLYDAMNKGIDRSTGEYLIFLNAGDELAAETVLCNVSKAIDQGAQAPDLVYGDAIDMTMDGKALYRKARFHRALWWTMFACHQAMFFRSERIDDQRYRLRFTNAGDYAFLAEFLHPRHEMGPPAVAQLDWPVCRFWLGGRSWERREETLKQDYAIRKRFIGVSAPLNAALYVLHRVHTMLKRRAPWLTRLMRGQREVSV